MTVWPLLWGLCASLALASHVAVDKRAARALWVVLAGYVLTLGSHAVFGEQPIYLAIGALIWGAVASLALRLRFTTCGGLIALSALCYLWANSFNAPRVFGSLPFVASDVLLVAAMVGIGRNGLAYIRDGIRDMDWGNGRDSRDPNHNRVASISKTQEKARQ